MKKEVSEKLKKYIIKKHNLEQKHPNEFWQNKDKTIELEEFNNGGGFMFKSFNRKIK
jgi:hypothetical protein